MKHILHLAFFLAIQPIFAQQNKGVEIVYGHKDGLAMTMVMLMPTANSKGKAIINVVSGAWMSEYAWALKQEEKVAPYLEAGYTVFNVMHGSQPRYNLQDAFDDVKRSVRFIRFHAKSLQIDPDKIGIMGESSGGHLALLVATTGLDIGIHSADSINSVSDKVQAVAVLFPPTDFLNYGEEGFSPLGSEQALKDLGLIALFDFKQWNERLQEYEHPSSEVQLRIAAELSPIYSVSPDDAPTLIVHGDLDDAVPLQQSESMIAALQQANVPSKLIIKKGEGHGWKDISPEQKLFIGWFDFYLK